MALVGDASEPICNPFTIALRRREYLTFSGSSLQWFDEDGKEVPFKVNDTTSVNTLKAFTGSPDLQPPEGQDEVDKGPIPEGIWWLKRDNLQCIDDLGFWRGTFGGTWPGGVKRWGKYRLWLEHDPETKNQGRTNLCVLGNESRNTGGNIHIYDSETDFTDMEVFKKNFVKRVESGGRLKMRVNYAQPANWRPPIDDPMLCLYSQGGHDKPWHGSFGENIRDNVGNHAGVDLLAKPGKKVYACVESVVARVYTSTSLAGHVVVLKVKDEDTFKELRNTDYKPTYKNEGEVLDINFNYDGPFYLVYMHLSKNDFFKQGEEVGPNDIIGLTGISGRGGANISTRNPHLHLEITNDINTFGFDKRCNPCIYFPIKTEHDLTPEDKSFQNLIKETLWQ
ncbi:peptidase, M23 family [Chitinispirillum alkaliphilum]|nr:peptidase, M23 family [Chitinispirillum alkaliphilum]